VQDYWLGGRDNFAADRQAGDEAIAAFPGLVADARSTRAFLDRAVRHLAAEAGIRQFLDIGAGIPTAGNTHEVAQSVAPEALVVYMDSDPVVFAHGRRMLASGPHGSTAYLDADLRDPGHIVAEAARMLDLSQPVALVLMAVLQFIPDDADPHKIVAMLLEALPPGSYLVISHPSSDAAAGTGEVLPLRLSQLMTEPVTPRAPTEIAQFFDGLQLVAPGLVRVPQWRPASAAAAASTSAMWGGVGRK
jgi:O-methyltransferase involved in polyketide biosynthesis